MVVSAGSWPPPRDFSLLTSHFSLLPSIPLPATLPGVERVGDSVAEEVEAEDQQCQDRARYQDQVGVVAPLVEVGEDHLPPARRRGLDTDAEIAQRRLGQDNIAEVDADGDDDRRDAIRHDVAEEDGAVTRAHR